jgi:hypothetical protein
LLYEKNSTAANGDERPARLFPCAGAIDFPQE